MSVVENKMLSIGDLRGLINDVCVGTKDEALQKMLESTEAETFLIPMMFSCAAACFVYSYESEATDIIRELLKEAIENGEVAFKDGTLSMT